MHLLRDIEHIEDLEYFEQCYRTALEVLSDLPQIDNNISEFIGLEVIYIKFYRKTWNNKNVRSFEFKHWKNYLRKSIRRDIINYHRFLQRRRRLREEFEKNYSLETSNTSKYKSEIDAEVGFDELIETLPKRAKEVTINHYYNGLSLSECADEMECTYDNIVKGKNLALRLLRKALLSIIL